MQDPSPFIRKALFPDCLMLDAVESGLRFLGYGRALSARDVEVVPAVFGPVQTATICVGVFLVLAVCSRGRSRQGRTLRGLALGAAVLHLAVSCALSVFFIGWGMFTVSSHYNAREQARLEDVCSAWVANTVLSWSMVAAVVGLAIILVSIRRCLADRKGLQATAPAAAPRQEG